MRIQEATGKTAAHKEQLPITLSAAQHPVAPPRPHSHDGGPESEQTSALCSAVCPSFACKALHMSSCLHATPRGCDGASPRRRRSVKLGEHKNAERGEEKKSITDDGLFRRSTGSVEWRENTPITQLMTSLLLGCVTSG